jgi:RimJ/RimL family protein N-acetyltransferase
MVDNILMFPVTLVGPRVVLRETTLADAEALAGISGHPLVFGWLPYDEVPTVEKVRQSLPAKLRAREKDDRLSYEWIVTLDGQPVGVGGLEVLNQPSRRGSIAYMVHPDHWGRGLAVEATGTIIEFGFAKLGLHRIEAATHPENLASRRVLEKNGMWLEGHHRHDRLVRGEWWDSLEYAILSPHGT